MKTAVRYNKPSCSATSMSRSRMPLQQLLANLQSYHTYLEQDKCANPKALAYVEQRISFCQSMKEHRNDSIGSGAQAGSETRTWCSGPKALSASSSKETVTT